MTFLKFNLTDGRGTVIINATEIQAILELSECTEIYLKGLGKGECFAVTETVKEIESKTEIFCYFDII